MSTTLRAAGWSTTPPWHGLLPVPQPVKPIRRLCGWLAAAAPRLVTTFDSTRPIDLVRGLHARAGSGSARTILAGDVGRAACRFTGNASTDTLNWGPSDLIPLPTGDCTVLFERRRTDPVAPGAANGLVFGPAGPAAAAECRAFCPNVATVIWDYGGTTSPNRLTWSGYTINVRRYERWAFVAGARGSAIWFNGVRQAVQTTAITRSAATQNFLVNGGSFNGDFQELSFFAVCASQIPDAVLAAWGRGQLGAVEVPLAWPTLAAAEAFDPATFPGNVALGQSGGMIGLVYA
jgi:hypothetical protein